MLKPLDKHEPDVFRRAARQRDEEHHGGAWKVAFADFCLALMSLFLVLWLMAAREQHSLQETMRNAQGGRLEPTRATKPGITGTRGSMLQQFPLARPPASATLRYASPADLEALARALAALSAQAGLAGNVQSVLTPQGLRVLLHDTDRLGMFVRGSAMPTPRFSRLLRQMGPLFAQMDKQMLVVGHTDSMPYAASGENGGGRSAGRDFDAYSNWTLSSNRAMAARAQLLLGGMRSDAVLQVVGMADRAPLDRSDASAAVNRRIELLVLTPAQARSVAAMFGVPGTGPPAAPELRHLQQQLPP